MEANPSPDDLSDEALWSALRDVVDPAIPQVDVVALGLIYDLRHCGGNVAVKMTTTTPHHPGADELRRAVAARLATVPGVRRVKAELVRDPEWNEAMMSPEARRRLGGP